MNKVTKISIRVVLLFTCAILMSFIPDNFHEFFGDWKCEGAVIKMGDFVGCRYGFENHSHSAQYHWGYRHWLFFAMGLVLFSIQVYDITEGK